jgi:hypothetical protein
MFTTVHVNERSSSNGFTGILFERRDI